MTNLNIFGDRVALRELQETFDTKIQVPERRNQSFAVGQVAFVGDGQHKGETCEMYLKVGDIVWFQQTTMTSANTLHAIDGKPIFVLPQGDVLARLKSTTMSIDEFEILGMYALVRPYIPKLKSQIVVPDNVQTQVSELTHYQLVQLGQQAAEHCKASIGKRVLLERMMVHHFTIDSVEYGFLPADRILAEVDGDVDVEQAGLQRPAEQRSGLILPE